MRFLPLLALLLPGLAWAAPLTDAQKAEIDARVARVLAATDVPSASIAVVTDSQLPGRALRQAATSAAAPRTGQAPAGRPG